MSGLILYTSPTGTTHLDLRVEGETVWLTQLEIAELFQTSKQNVSLHAKNIFEDGELAPDSVVKESLTTAADDKSYRTKLYNLDLTLDFWRNNVDRMLAFNDRHVLDGPGSVSREEMLKTTAERFEEFDTRRRETEAREADADDLKALEDLESEIKRKDPRS